VIAYETPDGRPSDTADRHFFAAIRNADHGAVEEATVRYSIPRTHILHKITDTPGFSGKISSH
jgi:hypothetical protein